MDLNIDDEWAQFLSKSRSGETSEIHIPKSESFTLNTVAPICGELNISTTTKVLFINQSVDINEVFWKIPIMKYEEPSDGIIKKQMKIVSHTQSEFDEYKRKLENVDYYSEHIIKRIDNPSARRIKFKDERKITVGVSKKDIMNCRGKVKNAFYNCFAMILSCL